MVPWTIRGARRERRLLGVVARRSQADGEGSLGYEAALNHVAAQPAGSTITISQVLVDGELLDRYQRPANATARQIRDVRQALQDSGWRETDDQAAGAGLPRQGLEENVGM